MDLEVSREQDAPLQNESLSTRLMLGAPSKRGARAKTSLGLLAVPVLSFLSLRGLINSPEQEPSELQHNVQEGSFEALSDGELKSLSLNVWGKPGFITGSSSERFDRIAQYLRSEHIDIATLQEVWFSLSEAAYADIGDADIARSSRHSSIFRKSGLVTVSKLPIQSATSFSFDAESGFESLSEKGALLSEIELPGGRSLHVWNVHLQSGGVSSDVRYKQVQQLISWLERSTSCDILMLSGDLNCTKGDKAFDALVDAFEALGQLIVSDVGPTYDPVLNPSASGVNALYLDHTFFVFPKGSSFEIDFARAFDEPNDKGEYPSDHFGVLSNLTFPSED